MSSTSWEEIKRLAADFQRIQLIDSTYKLSDRNCVQLVHKLASLNLISIFHTIDGKEYVTEDQIRKEIYDELYVNGGRVNVLNLQTLLNVDITHIEKRVQEITKNDPDLVVSMGQLISKTYINKISEDINDLLQEKSILPVSELSTFYEFPVEFLIQVLTQRLGTIIKGFLDNQVLYTEEYINKNKNILAGHLEASIKPIVVSQIIKDNELDSKMCFNSLTKLIDEKQVKGTLFGGGKQEMSVFIPDIYILAQKNYTESFFKQNGYLEYRALKKIGITEPEQYIKATFNDLKIHYLSSCCVSSFLLNQIESNVEDSLKTIGYCDISTTVPSVFNDKDISLVTNYLIKNSDDILQINPILISDKIIISEEYKKNVIDSLKDDMEQKANIDLKNTNVVLALRTNAGCATSGSKSSSKAKGKDKSKNKSDAKQALSDEINIDLSFINETQLQKKISDKSKDISEDVVEAIVNHIFNSVNQKYIEILYNKFETLKVSNETASAKEEDAPKNQFKDTQDKMKTLLVHSKIFDSSIKKFSNEKCQDLLKKHLTKTLCSDMCNLLFKYVAFENMIPLSDDYNAEARNKVMQKVKDPVKGLLTQLHNGMSEKSCSDLISLIETISGNILELQIKKIDAKKEKETVLELKNNLLFQIEKETDIPTILQVASILFYYTATNVILNAPGKCVPFILDALKTYLNDETYQKLNELQNIVMKSAPENPELVQEIKKISLNAKFYLKTESK